MKQVSSLISTYSSDEFGICSALYELGGMVVMHDASGCNSTYTTHDEPRWYDMDSNIFISAISEMEAIMGDDEKFLSDLEDTAKQLNPKFIAIVGAPIPYMIGTDFQAIASMTERRTGIPCFGFEANGMHWYTKGVSMALEKIVDHYCQTGKEKQAVRHHKLKVNLIGATPLDFCVNGSIESIKNWVVRSGMDVQACFSVGSSLEELQSAGEADVNLVLSYGGLAAAKLLNKRFDIPYVVGVPFGLHAKEVLAETLAKASNQKETVVFYKKANVCRKNARTNITSQVKVGVLGESVFNASLLWAMENRATNLVGKVLCPLDTCEELLRQTERENQDVFTPEEDDVIREIEKLDVLIADPLYEPLVKRFATHVQFVPLPHEAFSGRMYDAVNPNLVDGFFEWMDEWYDQVNEKKSNEIGG